MTRSELGELAAGMAAKWPHKPLPDAAVAQLWMDLRDLPAEHASAGLEALYREGREWPPTGAQIRGAVLELVADTPAWPEVWDRLLRAASKFGLGRTEEAIEWLTEWRPIAGQFCRLLPFRDLCLTTEVDVFRGQARRHWEAFAARAKRDAQLQGLPGAGLRTLERVNSDPSHIGGAMQRVLEAARPEGTEA